MLQMFPGLIKSLSQLFIHASDSAERAAVLKPGVACSNLLTMRGYKICCEIVEKSNPGVNNAEWLEAILKEPEQNFISIGLSPLIAQTTKLTTFSVDTHSMGCVPMLAGFFRYGDSQEPFPLSRWAKQMRSLLGSRLQVLYVNEQTTVDVRERHVSPGFAHFQQLMRLSVAYTGLSMGMATTRTVHTPAVTVGKLLPQSLEFLQVHVGHSRDVIRELEWFDGLFDKSEFPYLQHFELCSKHNLLSTAWYICTRSFADVYRTALVKWHRCNFSVLTTFGNEKHLDKIQRTSRDQLNKYHWGNLQQVIAHCVPYAGNIPQEDSVLKEALGYGDKLDCVIVGGY